MGTRAELDALLRETLGSNKVYFQPPDNLQISYPCIVYDLAGMRRKNADNLKYYRQKYYDLTFITRNPDDPIIDALADLPQCSMGRPYVSDNLHHYPYTIHF